jgi:hypothetical protein
MTSAQKIPASEPAQNQPVGVTEDFLKQFVPPQLRSLKDLQTDITLVAKGEKMLRLIDEAVQLIPTTHRLQLGDALKMSALRPESLHLVLTSPPYWTLKEYRDSEGQMGHIEGDDEFLTELDMVWRHCFRALVPGGRLVCVVGDVCLSRRKNGGRHTVVPLHASIQEHAELLASLHAQTKKLSKKSNPLASR